MKDDVIRLSGELRTVKAERDFNASEIMRLQAELADARADRDRYKLLAEETEKLRRVAEREAKRLMEMLTKHRQFEGRRP